MRRCVGCMQSRPQNELMRFTAAGSGIIADAERPGDGRGFYLCRNTECMEKAFKRKAFNRICRSVTDNDEIRKVIERKLENN